MRSSFNDMVVSAKRKGRRGLTLIEAAMVLTILALVVGGVMLYYSSANTNREVSLATSQIGGIQQAIRSAFAGQSGFTGLQNSVVVQSLPTSMTNGDGTTLTNAFGGAITLQPATPSGSQADAGFSVTFTGIPQEACVKLSAIDLGRSTYGVNVNGTDLPAPITATSAQSACSGNGTFKTIVWSFT